MLREILYVDVARVRSLLGQLDRGIVESVVEKRAEGAGTDFGTLLGFKGLRTTESSRAAEESRSVQDLLFTVFEEAATSEGLVRELDPDEVSDPARWQSSELHGRLEEGEILKLFCEIMVVDPQFVQDRFARFAALHGALATMTAGTVKTQLEALRSGLRSEADQELARLKASGVGRDQVAPKRREIEAQVKATIREAEELVRVGALAPLGPEVQSVIEVVNKFLSADAISVRFLACGSSEPQFAFSGSLLGRDEYIQRERDALFARYGSVLRGWTALVQVAAVPSESAGEAARQQDFAKLELIRGDTINRAAVEQAAIGLLGHLDALGISEGPLWPGVSVVPLGIYRVVPRSDQPGPTEHL